MPQVNSVLGDAVAIGSLRLRNRFVATAHASGLVHDGVPAPGDADYWRRVAAGGASLLISGGTVTAAESTPRRRNLIEAWRPEVVPGLERRTRAIHDEGALAVSQLVHLGRETLLVEGWYSPVGPAAVRSPREPTAPRALTAGEHDAVLEGHRVSAAHSVEAGFDAIELHAAHGYLAAQLLAPATNPDADAEARLQAVLAIGRALRDGAGGAPVGVRVSTGGAGEAGLDLDGLCAVLPALDAFFDWVNVTVGVRTTYVRDMATDRPPLLDDIATIRPHVSGPLIVSQAFRDPADAEEAIARGADLVGMARPLIADPDLPVKVLTGRSAEVRPCVSCNEDCRLFDPCLLCSVNPDLAPPGHDARPAQPIVVRPPRTPTGAVAAARRVAVIGAGPAGLECAVRLAAGGADVTLWDRQGRLGGNLAVAADAPNRAGWRRLLTFYAAALERNGVTVQLGAGPTTADLADVDEIVAATGSQEVAPDLPGAGHMITASAAIAAGDDALDGVERLVIVDDGYGWWPCVSALELGVAATVAQITVVTPSGAFAGSIPAESRVQLMTRLGVAAVRVRALMRLTGASATDVSFAGIGPGDALTLPADRIVVVGERVARPWDVAAAPAGAGVQLIGDAVVPRRVAHAISEGRAAAAGLLAVTPGGR